MRANAAAEWRSFWFLPFAAALGYSTSVIAVYSLIGAAAFLFPIIASALLLLDGSNPISQSIAAAVLGLTVGSEVDVIAYLAARHFGLKSFGALYGAMVMALSLGTAFGPLAAGALFDRFGSYAPFLMLTMFLTAASAIALFTLGPTPTAETAAQTT